MPDRNWKLCTAREALGISQAKLAKLLGVHVLTVSRWECGTMDPLGIHRELLTQVEQAAKKPGAGERIERALQNGVSSGLRALLRESKP